MMFFSSNFVGLFFLFKMINNFLVLNFLVFNKIMINFSISFSIYSYFLFMVFSITFFIFIYCNFYMEYMKIMNYFMIFLWLFLLSMILLTISESILLIFFSWDGLGITSYFLVAFFLNWKSNNSGMVTILSNRVGDFILLNVFIYIFVCNYFNFFNLKMMSLKLVLILLFLGMMTKSAQYPFSIWLPLAMAAPTPISALVHSSTLVTAGVMILIRFFNNLNSFLFLILLFYYCLITFFLSSLLSLNEMDLKKIIALSTLNQISFILICLSMKLKILSFIHLNIHAIFKSLLFLNIGIFLHFSWSFQDNRFSNKMNFSFLFFLISIFISAMSLMGLIFSSGFFSKDLILEKMFLYFIFPLLSMITIFYTFRILLLLFKISEISKMNFNLSNFSNFKSMFIPSLSSLMLGKMFFLNFFSFFLFTMISPFLLLVLIFSFLIIFPNLNKMIIHSVAFLHFFTFFFNKIFNVFFINFKLLMEKSWLEFFFIKFYMNLIFSFLLEKTLKSMNILIYIFLCLFVYLLMF